MINRGSVLLVTLLLSALSIFVTHVFVAMFGSSLGKLPAPLVEVAQKVTTPLPWSPVHSPSPMPAVTPSPVASSAPTPWKTNGPTAPVPTSNPTTPPVVTCSGRGVLSYFGGKSNCVSITFADEPNPSPLPSFRPSPMPTPTHLPCPLDGDSNRGCAPVPSPAPTGNACPNWSITVTFHFPPGMTPLATGAPWLRDLSGQSHYAPPGCYIDDAYDVQPHDQGTTADNSSFVQWGPSEKAGQMHVFPGNYCAGLPFRTADGHDYEILSGPMQLQMAPTLGQNFDASHFITSQRESCQ